MKIKVRTTSRRFESYYFEFYQQERTLYLLLGSQQYASNKSGIRFSDNITHVLKSQILLEIFFYINQTPAKCKKRYM